MVGEIVSALGALKTASDLAKALMGVRDAAVIDKAVADLNQKLFDAIGLALTARERETALLDRIRELEKEIARMHEWDAGKERYQLKEIGPGAFAYATKADKAGGTPAHWCCANCFENRQRSLLQKRDQVGRDAIYLCPRCKAVVTVPWGRSPGKEG